jgi:hypothetical protein
MPPAAPKKPLGTSNLPTSWHLHAQTEEEVLYPAAVLVGDIVRSRSRTQIVIAIAIIVVIVIIV